MLRTMLAERFGLKFHRESRNITVYALVVGKHGFKLREATDPQGSYTQKLGSFVATGSLNHMTSYFRNFSDRPLVNMTGVQGIYHIDLHWAPEDGRTSSGTYDPLFWMVAERDTGLKIEKRDVPRDVLVIDHAEREPSAN